LKSILYSFLAFVGTVAFADVKPGILHCKVTEVTPVGANFFTFSEPIVVGDTTDLDLSQPELAGIKFASGATIGHTSIPHPLIKQEGWEGLSYYVAEFQSQHNQNHYVGVLNATDDEAGPTIVSVQALERRTLGGMTLHSAVMECTR